LKVISHKKTISDAEVQLTLLGAAVSYDGKPYGLAERIKAWAKENDERVELWTDEFIGDLRRSGVSEEAIKSARDWANHVLSK
jgi:hypothetical protein